MNRKIILDIDGVLADFEGAFCEEFGYDRRELVSLESRYPNQARRINKFINDGFVYKNLKPIQLGLDIATFLNMKFFDIHIVTSRPFGLDSVTRGWLKRHGVNFSTYTSDRSKTGTITLARPLCAVDDLFSVYQALLKHNIPTIIVSQPWNNYIGENMRRINNLSEFVQNLNEIIQGK